MLRQCRVRAQCARRAGCSVDYARGIHFFTRPPAPAEHPEREVLSNEHSSCVHQRIAGRKHQQGLNGYTDSTRFYQRKQIVIQRHSSEETANRAGLLYAR